MENLFSYGTLQLASVQQATFGRLINGYNDSIVGFNLTFITITDKDVLASSGQNQHPMIHYTDKAIDAIKGMVFEITEQELNEADVYEVADYKRIAVTLASGTTAWVYVNKNTEI